MRKNTSKYCFFRKLGLLFGLILTNNTMHYCIAMNNENPIVNATEFSVEEVIKIDEIIKQAESKINVNNHQDNESEFSSEKINRPKQSIIINQPIKTELNNKSQIMESILFNKFIEKIDTIKKVLGKKINPDPSLNLSNEYTIIEEIGKGAQGCVFLYQHKKLPRQIAVKCATQENERYLDLAKEARFLNKLSQCKCEGIIQYYGFYVQTNQKLWTIPSCTVCYLAMEYAPNSSLENYVLNHQKLDENFIRYIAKQIFATLCQLHKKRIVYLDLKLPNIVLIEDKPKIIDFGWAEKLVKGCDTINKSKFNGAKILECDYFPPEVDSRCPYNKITYKADFWSFGYMIYRLLYLINRKKTPELKILQSSKEKMNIEIPFDGFMWNKEEAKKIRKFVESLMKCNPDERPSAEEIENNEWLKECPSAQN